MKIKFRAWLKCANKMLKVENIFFKDKMVMLDKNYELGCCRDFDDVELMQFTGLHDVNGKEIFDCDVVRFYGDDDVNGIYLVVWSEKDCSFQLLDNEGYTKSFSEFEFRLGEFEVLGNIYENKSGWRKIKQDFDDDLLF